MKLSLIDLLAVKLEIFFSAVLSIFAIVSEDKQLSTVGWAMIGSTLGGFVFTYISQPSTIKEWILRWGANFASGVVVGLVIAAHYSSNIINIPLPYFTMLCSFFSGPITVIAIPMGLPVITSYIKDFFKKITRKDRKTKNEQSGN